MADADATKPERGEAPSTAERVGAVAEVLREGDTSPTETVTSPPQQPGRRGRRLPRFTRGGLIGRYVIVDLLGKGGMGDVYAAYDPELDRRIALKLVRDVTGDGRESLIAEA